MLSNEEQSTIVEKLGEDITSVLETVRMGDNGLIAVIEDDQGHEHEIELTLTYL